MKNRWRTFLAIDMAVLMVLIFSAEDQRILLETSAGVSEETETQADTALVKSGQEIKKIALTFDDGPNPDYTMKLLDGLKDRNVKATFFLLGNQVELYPDIVKRMHEDGHLIGNHSYEHVDLSKLSEQDACAQVEKTNDLIYKITGEYPQYIRPPYGSWKKNLDGESMMVEVLWDVDPLDWCCSNPDTVYRKVISSAREDDIILLHDAYESSIDAALRIVDSLQKEGYEFVTVDQLIFE